MELPTVATEQHPLATVYQQDNLVRHIGGQLQRQRTPVDEIVLIREPGAVLQSAKPPVHLFKTKRFYFEVLFQNEASLLEQNQTAFKWTSNPI